MKWAVGFNAEGNIVLTITSSTKDGGEKSGAVTLFYRVLNTFNDEPAYAPSKEVLNSTEDVL